jgi:hypothetical protein
MTCRLCLPTSNANSSRDSSSTTYNVKIALRQGQLLPRSRLSRDVTPPSFTSLEYNLNRGKQYVELGKINRAKNHYGLYPLQV